MERLEWAQLCLRDAGLDRIVPAVAEVARAEKLVRNKCSARGRSLLRRLVP
jgi:hypothetical protein